jgi:flagellin
MGMRINTNTAAMNAYRNLSVNDSQMSKSLEKLSSGFRINRAADDAAGLAISEGLRSQIGGLKVAVRNAQDGVSVVQTAEGALAETTSILQRMRDLSVQASNDGGLSTAAKGNLQSEISQLNSELNRIASSTSFNGKKLLDGSYTGNFQVGANSGEVISIAIGSTGKGMDATGLGVSGIDLTGVGTFATAAATGTASTVATTNASSGSAAVLTFTASNASSGTAAFASAASGVSDSAALAEYKALDGSISYGGKSFNLASVDYSGVTSASGALAALNTAANAALGTTGNRFAVATNSAQLTFTAPANAASSSAADIATATPVFAAGTGASAAIAKLDAAISKVSTQRADLGAIQNRFEHTIANLNTAVENLSESESRIRDTDMASEMTNFSKNQILVQAGTAMLAQANSSSQSVLKLLQ